MLLIRRLSIFKRLLAWITGAGLLIALVSGAAHYLFELRLVQSSMLDQMRTVLHSELAHFDRTYATPVSRGLQSLAGAPALDRLLAPGGADDVPAHAAMGRLALSLGAANPGLYRSVAVLGTDGGELALIRIARPLHDAPVLPDVPGTPVPPGNDRATLFEKLRDSNTKGIVFAGPLRGGQPMEFLAGIARRNPTSDAFAGAVIARFDASRYLGHLADTRTFGSSIIWLLDSRGTILYRPSAAPVLDPTPFMFSRQALPPRTLVVSSLTEANAGIWDLFHIALSMPPALFSRQLEDARTITTSVGIAIVLFSALIALIGAKQLTVPIQSLSTAAALVSRGNLDARAPEHWAGELGELACSFNRMVANLERTTVSKAYLDGVIEHIGDAVLIIDERGVIETANPAAQQLFSAHDGDLTGHEAESLLGDAAPTAWRGGAEGPRAPAQGAGGQVREVQGRRVDGSAFCLDMRLTHMAIGGRHFEVCVARDVTERKQTLQALEASERRFRALYQNNPSMFFTIDANGMVISANNFGAKQLGYTAEALIGIPWHRLHVDAERALMEKRLEDSLMQPGNINRWEVHKRCRDGTTRWVRETVRAVNSGDGAIALFSVCEDITEAHRLAQQISYQATHDALTGLVNRREFEHRLHRVLKTAGTAYTENALCYLDLDQFKVINDTCGHIAGDELLRQLGAVLNEKVRNRDTLARLGGDEFAVLMEKCPVSIAGRVADALRRAIQEYRFVWQGKTFTIGVSIGLVPINAASGSPTAVLSAADNACYSAKEQGRNRIHIYREDDVELVHRSHEMQWVARINRALEEHRFQLWCQPIVPVDTYPQSDLSSHYELLIRMEDEEGGIVPPDAFLPAAERYNLSTKLDRWVINTAFHCLSDNPAHVAKLSLCSINLSGLSMGDEEFLDFLLGTFHEVRIPAHKICFEVTETAAIANLAHAGRFINSLRQLGCRFALDDFGSGLSSFAYLKNLPVDFLKIDGMFVKDIVDDKIDRAMVRSINDIAQVMNKQTIAEFVENDAILDELRDIGIDFAQGYGIGRPQPMSEITFLENAV